MGEASALLVPGWGTDPVRLVPLVRAVREAGTPASIWAYRPRGTLADLAAQLEDRLDGLQDAPAHLVGHSLGGLIAAATALRGSADVRSVTTINSPWRGTWVSYTGTGRLADALRWGSDELATLRSDLRRHVLDPDGPSWLLLSVAGDLATPPSTALRAGPSSPRLRRLLLRGVGHSRSLASPVLHTAVVDHLRTLPTTSTPATPAPPPRRVGTVAPSARGPS